MLFKHLIDYCVILANFTNLLVGETRSRRHVAAVLHNVVYCWLCQELFIFCCPFQKIYILKIQEAVVMIFDKNCT